MSIRLTLIAFVAGAALALGCGGGNEAPSATPAATASTAGATGSPAAGATQAAGATAAPKASATAAPTASPAPIAVTSAAIVGAWDWAADSGGFVARFPDARARVFEARADGSWGGFAGAKPGEVGLAGFAVPGGVWDLAGSTVTFRCENKGCAQPGTFTGTMIWSGSVTADGYFIDGTVKSPSSERPWAATKWTAVGQQMPFATATPAPASTPARAQLPSEAQAAAAKRLQDLKCEPKPAEPPKVTATSPSLEWQAQIMLHTAWEALSRPGTDVGSGIGYCRDMGSRPSPADASGRVSAVPASAFLVDGRVDCRSILHYKFPNHGIPGKHVLVAVYEAPADATAATDTSKPPQQWCGY